MSTLSLKFGMETGLPTRNMTFLLTLLLYVKLTSSFHYNAGHTYRMQMVKEVTLKNNGLVILHGSKLSP